jgi:uncharacterized repeat protein (TIGR03803 family)
LRPSGGLIIDRTGMLYGTTTQGGARRKNKPPLQQGVIFNLIPPNAGDSSWQETQLFVFPENADGVYFDGSEPQDLTYAGLEAGTPYDRVSPLFGFAPDGGLSYEETGGSTHPGNGTVFMFNPPASQLGQQCPFVLLHSFSGAGTTFTPNALTVGPDGAVYGTTASNGSTPDKDGGVFRLAPRDPDNLCGGWTFRLIYEFDRVNGSFGYNPRGLAFGPDGELYVSVALGDGGVIRLRQPANPNRTWHPSIVYQVADDNFGIDIRHIVFGSDGFLYAGTASGGTHGMGTVFRLIPQRGGHVPWKPQLLYAFGDNANDGSDVASHLAFGPDGALYGTTYSGGAGGGGTTFKLTPPGNNPTDSPWIETKLHDFSGPDGARPEGNIAFGADGTLYSTTNTGDPDYHTTYVNGYAYAIGP